MKFEHKVGDLIFHREDLLANKKVAGVIIAMCDGHTADVVFADSPQAETAELDELILPENVDSEMNRYGI